MHAVAKQNCWAPPPGVMRALQQHLSIAKERFAGPLSLSSCMDTYWSCHERDQLFGARHDAYSCRWAGHSECDPEYNTLTCTRPWAGWAVRSAQATAAPVLTLLVLPDRERGSNAAYNSWMQEAPANCHLLMQIPNSCYI